MTAPRRPSRAEQDPQFQARRQAADLAAEALRRRSLWIALFWFCLFQLLGAAVAFSSFHTRDQQIGRALLALGYFVGNAGSFLAAWWTYIRRADRGDW